MMTLVHLGSCSITHKLSTAGYKSSPAPERQAGIKGIKGQQLCSCPPTTYLVLNDCKNLVATWTLTRDGDLTTERGDPVTQMETGGNLVIGDVGHALPSLFLRYRICTIMRPLQYRKNFEMVYAFIQTSYDFYDMTT